MGREGISGYGGEHPEQTQRQVSIDQTGVRRPSWLSGLDERGGAPLVEPGVKELPRPAPGGDVPGQPTEHDVPGVTGISGQIRDEGAIAKAADRTISDAVRDGRDELDSVTQAEARLLAALEQDPGSTVLQEQLERVQDMVLQVGAWLSAAGDAGGRTAGRDALNPCRS